MPAEQSKAVPEGAGVINHLWLPLKSAGTVGSIAQNPIALLHRRFKIFIPSHSGSLSSSRGSAERRCLSGRAAASMQTHTPGNLLPLTAAVPLSMHGAL